MNKVMSNVETPFTHFYFIVTRTVPMTEEGPGMNKVMSNVEN